MLDSEVIAAYTPPYQRGAISALAKKYNVQPHDVAFRAKKLGLKSIMPEHWSRNNVQFWSDEEVRLLNAYPTMIHARLYELFKRRGFNRSVNSIMAKRLNLGWRYFEEIDETSEGYTAIGVGRLLKVNHVTVMRWINTKLLKATRENIYVDKTRYRVHRKYLKDFMVNNLARWEPANCDKYWLIDLLTNP